MRPCRSEAHRDASWLALVALVMLTAARRSQSSATASNGAVSRGVKELDTNALRACIATEQREKITPASARLVGGSCGEPPSTKSAGRTRLFAPHGQSGRCTTRRCSSSTSTGRAWYQARGFYGVHIDEGPSPDEARSQTLQGADCAIEITVKIDEGEPVRMRKIDVVGRGQDRPQVQKQIDGAVDLEKGDIFDEAHYDAAITELASVLREAGTRAWRFAAYVISIAVCRGDIKYDITPVASALTERSGDQQGQVPEGPCAR